MARSSSANAHGRAGGSNMGERLTVEYVGQECGAIITSIIYKLSDDEFRLKMQDKEYLGDSVNMPDEEFDLFADRTGADIEYRIGKTFIDVVKTLERNPEWIYEIESLFEKLYDERTIESK